MTRMREIKGTRRNPLNPQAAAEVYFQDMKMLNGDPRQENTQMQMTRMRESEGTRRKLGEKC